MSVLCKYCTTVLDDVVGMTVCPSIECDLCHSAMCWRCGLFEFPEQMNLLKGDWFCNACLSYRQDERLKKRQRICRDANTPLTNASRTITRLGWVRALTNPRFRSHFPIGYVGPGMPMVDHMGRGFLPVPGISSIVERLGKTDLMLEILREMLLSNAAPDEIVIVVPFGTYGRVIPYVDMSTPCVDRIDGKDSPTGQHWGFANTDLLYLGHLYRNGRMNGFIPPAPDETLVQRERRHLTMSRLLADPDYPERATKTFMRVWVNDTIILLDEADLAETIQRLPLEEDHADDLERAQIEFFGY